MTPNCPAFRPAAPSGNAGFVLVITLLMVLGVSAICVGSLYSAKMGRMTAGNYEHKLRSFLAADGMVTLLAQEVVNGNVDKYKDMSHRGRVRGELWRGLPGGDVRAFITHTRRYPRPDSLVTSSYLGSSLAKDNYGVKWSGWIIPPYSGNYTFYTRSDDGSQFFLSSDDAPENLGSSPVCYLDGWVVAWPTSGTAVSAPIPLIEGKRYYFEYYHKDGIGFDVGQMGWDGPESFSERPITGQYLSSHRVDADWVGTDEVGTLPVRYQVLGAGENRYRITSEAIVTRPGRPGDTLFRTPLVQALSVRGKPVPKPRRMWMRVIHYDYLSDGSSNEFNPEPYQNRLFTDIVQHRLTDFTTRDAGYFNRTSIGKPTHFRPSRSFSCGVGKWFKDWTPDYNPYTYAAWDDCNTRRYDASGDNWRNRKYYDSLEFLLDSTQGPNTYVFSRMGNYDTGDPKTSWRGDTALYFPLDRYGQDPPGSGHNFGFCTEMHTTFVHQSGLKFEFTGDDDVWVFVNDSLVIDLGGIHYALNAILNLDDLTGLEYGKVYNFDLFQCERHVFHSTSRMVTNIKMVPTIGAPSAQWRRNYSMNH